MECMVSDIFKSLSRSEIAIEALMKAARTQKLFTVTAVIFAYAVAGGFIAQNKENRRLRKDIEHLKESIKELERTKGD